METSPGLSGMDEIYVPKKGFEDLFAALLEEYKREIQTVSDAIAKQRVERLDVSGFRQRPRQGLDSKLPPCLRVDGPPLVGRI